MGIKKSIKYLLQFIEAGATQSSHEHHAAIVRKALDASELDCLVEHSPDKPPNNRRNVQITCSRYQGWITAFCERNVWHTVPGVYSPGQVFIWRELPSVNKHVPNQV